MEEDIPLGLGHDRADILEPALLIGRQLILGLNGGQAEAEAQHQAGGRQANI